LLGQIPIDIATRESGDRGMPITAEAQDSPVGAEFMKIAQELRKTLP
jgi:ATP-binding protein involved in chromosome partitioning